ncbi:glucosamine-6-phosphate deaminase [Salinicoccus jeotgali]|uniref:Glucosamine-6-phosphate deaminase n=1 Tax=Salinicoccus jeotgali TaxID=381634 RepID=A0ABP7E4Y1_9STAP
MKLERVENYNEMSQKTAEAIYDKIVNSDRVVLGLATGSTPEKMYEILAEMLNENSVDLSHVYTVNLDEYVGLASDHPQSYHHYMKNIFFDHVSIPPENTFIPDGAATDLDAEVKRYDRMLEEIGGVDLQLLGIGRNGHIAFNEPGTAFDSRTHVVDLAETTIKDNARFFNTIEEVPTRAISMGLDTIMDAKSILLIASGEGKAAAIDGMINGEESEDMPATVLQRHDDVTVLADEAAIGKL